jgi:chaperonin GroEL
MSKQYSSSQTLHDKIMQGVNTLADNVAATLGPRGRNVILHQKDKQPIVTKDGVTVAKFVDLEDPIENVGAQIIKEAASQTNANAGDGTTTATVLSRAILQRAQKYLAAGSAPVDSTDDIRHVATISANNDEAIGNLIATAVDQAGKDGAITVEEAKSLETSLDVIEGFRFDSGYLANAFITDERKGAVKYDNCFMLVTDYKIDAVEDIMPHLRSSLVTAVLLLLLLKR